MLEYHPLSESATSDNFGPQPFIVSFHKLQSATCHKTYLVGHPVLTEKHYPVCE